jgi:hypothetical protein
MNTLLESIIKIMITPEIFVAFFCLAAFGAFMGWYIWEMLVKDTIADYKMDKARKVVAAEYAYKAERAAVERARWKEHGSMFEHIIAAIKSDTVAFNALENDAARRNYLAEKMQPYVLADGLTFTHKYGNALSSYLAEQSKLKLGNGHVLNYLKDDVSIDEAVALVKAQRRNKNTVELTLTK